MNPVSVGLKNLKERKNDEIDHSHFYNTHRFPYQFIYDTFLEEFMKQEKNKRIIDFLPKGEKYTTVSGRVTLPLYQTVNAYRKKIGVSWNKIMQICLERLEAELKENDPSK